MAMTALTYTLFIALAGLPGPTQAAQIGVCMPPGSVDWRGSALSEFDALRILPSKGETVRIAMGDQYGVLRVLQWREGAFVEIWRSRELRSPIRGVLVDDIDADGEQEIVAYTEQGRVLFFSAATYERLWETAEFEFPSIDCLAIANVDDDDAKEIIISSSAAVHVYDPAARLEQLRSQNAYVAQEMAVGDVDGDGIQEIVLNTGPVLDCRFLDLEWDGPRYGARIALADVDGDGILEIIGEGDDRTIRMYDVDLRQMKLPH